MTDGIRTSKIQRQRGCFTGGLQQAVTDAQLGFGHSVMSTSQTSPEKRSQPTCFVGWKRQDGRGQQRLLLSETSTVSSVPIFGLAMAVMALWKTLLIVL